MKQWHLWVSFAAIAVVGFLFSQDALARFFWRYEGRPDIAAMLVRSDAALAMEIGNYYFGNGAYDPRKAGGLFKKAVAADPRVLWGHYQIARIEFVEGNFENALSEINQELAANPENLRSLYVRGLIQGYRGDLAAAEEDFRRFTEWAPKEWAGYNDLVWVLLKEGKSDTAAQEMDRAFAAVPDAEKNPWLWNARGVAELNTGRYQDASGAFERALERARSLTASEWRGAYPGNDPANSLSAILAFRKVIADNLVKAKQGAVHNPPF